MNEVTQLTVVCTRITHDANGKAKETKRRFANLNLKATEADIRSFVDTVSHLTGEQFDKIEVVQTHTLA